MYTHRDGCPYQPLTEGLWTTPFQERVTKQIFVAGWNLARPYGKCILKQLQAPVGRYLVFFNCPPSCCDKRHAAIVLTRDDSSRHRASNGFRSGLVVN